MKIATQYFNIYYRDKYIKQFVRRFRQKMGIALANNCIELLDDECPYFVIAKDISKNTESQKIG